MLVIVLFFVNESLIPQKLYRDRRQVKIIVIKAKFFTQPWDILTIPWNASGS